MQVEEEKEDLARQLQHEKSARLLQEQINQEQRHLHDSFSAAREGATPLSAAAPPQQVTSGLRTQTPVLCHEICWQLVNCVRPVNMGVREFSAWCF